MTKTYIITQEAFKNVSDVDFLYMKRRGDGLMKEFEQILRIACMLLIIITCIGLNINMGYMQEIKFELSGIEQQLSFIKGRM